MCFSNHQIYMFCKFESTINIYTQNTHFIDQHKCNKTAKFMAVVMTALLQIKN